LSWLVAVAAVVAIRKIMALAGVGLEASVPEQVCRLRQEQTMLLL
jgi:hypothetical protein